MAQKGFKLRLEVFLVYRDDKVFVQPKESGLYDVLTTEGIMRAKPQLTPADELEDEKVVQERTRLPHDGFGDGP